MLRLITAWSSDQLADWIGSWLSTGNNDPFAHELVVVPTPGMERYLTRRLARSLGTGAGTTDGVCAGIEFMHPGDLVAKVAAETIGEDDPWDPTALQWHCLAAIDDLLDDSYRPDSPDNRRAYDNPQDRDDSYNAEDPENPEDPDSPEERVQRTIGLRNYLREEHRDARRLDLARRVANLLLNYSLQRPDLIEDWTHGRTETTPASHMWQYEVFRHVLQRTHQEPWPARLRDSLAGGIGRIEDLPSRFAVFGVTRFGELELQCLRALARDREVAVLMVQHTLMDRHTMMDQQAGHTKSGNRLVSSFAKEEDFTLNSLLNLRPDHHHLDARDSPPSGLLGRLQSSIALNRELAIEENPPAPGDASLTVHGCSGALRQVEALRDQILQLLQADPTLQPRDVLVMCTDLDQYAPLIAHVLGTSASPAVGPTKDFGVRIADRVLRVNNPVMQVVASLTQLLTTRLTATDVLDFIEVPAVGQRFGLDDEDHRRLESLVRSSGVRWGMGPSHRRAFDIPVEDDNTWQSGLDRLALGLAVDGRETDLVGGVAPMEAARDDDQRVIGALAAVIDILDEALTFSETPHPARDWATAIAGWVEALVDSSEAQWQLAAAMEAVSGALDADNHITLLEVVGLLTEDLSRYSPQPDLLAGGVAVAAMRPMRNIPFRVVCLVGMDDGSFPRSVALGGDDILAVDPKPGERDPGAEDRQLFLDALCAAEQHVVITYSSRDAVTGKRLPPATPLAELLDELGDVVHEHPLSPYDGENFATAGSPAAGSPPAGSPRAGSPSAGFPSAESEPFSYDLAAAAVASRGQEAPALLREVRLSPDHGDTTLDELLAFWKNPAKAFLRNLRLPVASDSDPADDELSIDLDGLAKWGVGNELLTSHRARAAAFDVAVARGALPVHDPASTWDEVAEIVSSLQESAAGYQADSVNHVRVDVPMDLPDTSTPQGRLTGILPVTASGVLVDISYSSRHQQHELSMRIRLAALAAMDRRVTGVMIRRKTGKTAAEVTEIAPPETSQEALDWLRLVARLRWQGLAQPLPFAVETSNAYVKAGPGEVAALAAAEKKWSPSFGPVPGEGERREHVLLWDGDLATMHQVPAWPSWTGYEDEPSLFAQIASFIFGETG